MLLGKIKPDGADVALGAAKIDNYGIGLKKLGVILKIFYRGNGIKSDEYKIAE